MTRSGWSGSFCALPAQAILFALAIPARLGLHRGTEGGAESASCGFVSARLGPVPRLVRSLPFAHILTVYWS